jgi:hypothetical protein
MPAVVEPAELDLKLEQRRIRKGVAAAFLVSAAVLGAAHSLLPRLIRFPQPNLEARLTFWAGAAVFLVLWIMIGVGMVSRGRRHSAADIRGSAFSGPSPKIAVSVAFLQNTLEQGVIATVLLFALVMFLPTAAMPLIAGSVLLFAMGRATFLAGYPKGAGARSFGMALTVCPSLFAFVLVIGAMISRL